MKNVISIQYFKSPMGELLMGSYDSKLCICDWRYRKMRSVIDRRILGGMNAEYVVSESPVIENTKIQLNEYFKGIRKTFNIPLLFIGSDFQKKVWNALLDIPYGTTSTYIGLTKKLGDKNAIRAVASANGANALSILVPCHRIIGSDGKLVGYAGGLETKKKLLNLENALFRSQMSLF